MKKFTPQEDKFLMDNYLTIPAKRMSQMLGRCEAAARQRMQLLGIKVPAEIAKKFQRENRFQKGHESFNKGKRMAEYMSQEAIERTAATRFQKGNLPHNHVDVGSMRITKDGCLEIKIAEPNKWQYYHRLMWEETFGAIPRGMNVAFVTADKLNVNPWNLMLETRAQNMKRNSYHNNFPKDAAQVIQLLGALKRKINKHQKKLSDAK
jgi:hypothetical protein